MEDYEFICPICKRIYDYRYEERQKIINNKWEFVCFNCAGDKNE